MQFIIPIIISVFALKFTQVCGYIFITIHAYIFLYCLYLYYMKKPTNELLSIFDDAEKEVFLRYHVAIVFPFGARDFSCHINGFRWIGLLVLAPIMFIKGFWIPGSLSVALFFLSAEISLRLDPFYFLPIGASKSGYGDLHMEYELRLLRQVDEKFNKYLNDLDTT